MTTVFNNLVTPDGEPLENARVEVRLVWNKHDQRVATDQTANVIIYGVWAVRTDENGRWEVELTPNEDITPDSVYKIIERVPPGETKYAYFIEVPGELATPVDNWVGDILVDEPTYA